MFWQCANPECHSPFNYRQGRLFRFSNIRPGRRLLENACVRHFWLCSNCNRDDVLEYKTDVGIVLRSRPGSVVQRNTLPSVCCCPMAMDDSCGKQDPRGQSGKKLSEEHLQIVAATA